MFFFVQQNKTKKRGKRYQPTKKKYNMLSMVMSDDKQNVLVTNEQTNERIMPLRFENRVWSQYFQKKKLK